jgi:hypothetical protein
MTPKRVYFSLPFLVEIAVIVTGGVRIGFHSITTLQDDKECTMVYR